MARTSLRLASAALLLGVLVLAPGETTAAKPVPSAVSLDHDEVITGGADPTDRLPLIVVLHGRGGGAGKLRPLLQRLRSPARVVFPRGPVRLADGRRAWFRPRADGRELEEVAGAVGAATDELGEFLATIQQDRPTCGKPVVVGWSQGGVLAFTLALEHPELLARAIVVAGTVPERLVPDSLWPHAPISALHGMKDARVSYRHARDVVDRLGALGYEVELQSYPGAPHELDESIRRDVQRLVTLEAARLGAEPACHGS